ncbi:ATP-binding protein [Roseisolibacter agri]|uniref:histidine kinase n=1 Tax=Roseisolibacter agri TaxID=2014610 RepID=A0AA37V0P0_9BACT|nr:ATP-binding protein [Roseisolibacter agri]GLC24895.1 sensor histidine kinase [Roseisolibacter agri]
MPDDSLLERLAAHRTLAAVPREQLEWLARTGHLRVLEPGDILTASGPPVAGLYVVLDGHLSIRVDRGAGPRIVMEWHGGDVTGLLPYSRIKTPPGNVVAERRTEVFMVEPPDIARMIRECHELTAVMVHVMIDRARVFKSSELLDEKMASLGRLAAGLAHELNNPASAVARSAKTLVAELKRLEDATKAVCELDVSDTQYFSIAALRDDPATARRSRSPLEAADREDALADWLDDRGVAGVSDDTLAELARSGFGVADVQAVEASVGTGNVGTVLEHVAVGHTVRRLADEICSAASRIHALVDAVKGFTHMDQQATLKPVAIGRGLSDTITMLGAKARDRSVAVDLTIAPDLPPVDGYGGELNQVWVNLLDNAIDAAPGGHVHVTADVELGKVVVRVADDGHGIPAEVLARVFDPFFTTKEVGAGTGLGLDIARRIAHRHHGVIDVASGAQGTTFSVTLPTSTEQEPAQEQAS